MTTKIIIEKTYKCDNKNCGFFAKHLMYVPIHFLNYKDALTNPTTLSCYKCKGYGIVHVNAKIRSSFGLFDRNVPARKNKPKDSIFKKFPAGAGFTLLPIKPDYFEHTYCSRADIKNHSNKRQSESIDMTRPSIEPDFADVERKAFEELVHVHTMKTFEEHIKNIECPLCEMEETNPEFFTPTGRLKSALPGPEMQNIKPEGTKKDYKNRCRMTGNKKWFSETQNIQNTKKGEN